MAILAARSNTTVIILSSRAWMLSVINPRLFENRPKLSSTTNAERIANKEICKTLVLWTNIDILILTQFSLEGYYYCP